MDLSNADDEDEAELQVADHKQKSDGVTRAEVLNTCVPLVLCASSARLP